MPGITTIAKTRVIPATKEHNSADEIKDISNIFTLFPLAAYPLTKVLLHKTLATHCTAYITFKPTQKIAI